jgi:hypothetical protein
VKGASVSKSDKQLWNALASIGCIACLKDGRPNAWVSIHHIDGRSKPGAHQKVLPLCAEHHQQNDADPLGRVAVHPNKKRFEQKYGNQYELLEESKKLAGVE